jgi:hypothetical protein
MGTGGGGGGEEVRAAGSVLRVSVPVVGRTPVGKTPLVGTAVSASRVAIGAPVHPPVNSAVMPISDGLRRRSFLDHAASLAVRLGRSQGPRPRTAD